MKLKPNNPCAPWGWIKATLVSHNFDSLTLTYNFGGPIHVSLMNKYSTSSLINDFFFCEFLDTFFYVWQVFRKKSKSEQSHFIIVPFFCHISQQSYVTREYYENKHLKELHLQHKISFEKFCNLMWVPSFPNSENSSLWRKETKTKSNTQIFSVCTACCTSCRRIRLKFKIALHT